MKLSELMASATVNPNYEGYVTADDYVLAMDCGATAATDWTGVMNFDVVQMGVAGLDSNLNPITQDKTYIRAGQSTMKTGNQRSFAVTGDRYVGDDWQDFVLGHGVKYGTGSAVVRKYVYFNILNGIGEKGEACIIVNSDGSGTAGNSSEIDIELRKSGAAPTQYSFPNVEHFSGDGSTTQFTLTASPAPTAIYKVFVGGTEQTTGWTYSSATHKVTFTTAPASGTDNIAIYYNL